jgi:hypothetical protein
MGIILIPIYIVYLLLSIGITIAVKRSTRSKSAVITIVIVLILIPTYDIFLTNLLGFYYCSTDTEAKTFVDKTVQTPGGIYWEDNVYPGFDIKDRERMVKSYLDGVTIKRIALNSPSGRIYEYSYEEVPQPYVDFLKEYEIKHNELKAKRSVFDRVTSDKESYPNWVAVRDDYLAFDKEFQQYRLKLREMKKDLNVVENRISLREAESFPFIVRMDLVPLNAFSKHFVYSDEVHIIDTSVNKVIAKNRRYMKRMYNILPSSGGDYYYQPSRSLCGYSQQERFDTKIFVGRGPLNKHRRILNFQLNDRSHNGGLF